MRSCDAAITVLAANQRPESGKDYLPLIRPYRGGALHCLGAGSKRGINRPLATTCGEPLGIFNSAPARMEACGYTGGLHDSLPRGLVSLFSTEPIANALNGLDHRSSVAKFSQRADDDVHYIAFAVVALFPHILQ